MIKFLNNLYEVMESAESVAEKNGCHFVNSNKIDNDDNCPVTIVFCVYRNAGDIIIYKSVTIQYKNDNHIDSTYPVV